jgi:hypothetical protein
MKRREYFEDIGIIWRIIRVLRRILKKWGLRLWTRIATSDELFYT